MLFTDITIIDENQAFVPHRYVRVEGEKITHIGGAVEPNPGEEMVCGTDKLLMAGLYNMHCHVPMTLLRGYAEGLPLDRWLHERVFPFEGQLTGEDVRRGTMLGIAEMIRFGVVSFSEMYDHCDQIAEACIETGIKANISRGVTCFDETPPNQLRGLIETKSLYETYHNAADGRIKIDVSIHAEYTSNPHIVTAAADYAKSVGTRMHIHLSETEKEHNECIARRGMTPAGYMNACGVFDVPALAAHCVWVSDEDIDLMADKGVTAAHCPVSNLKLGSGFADIVRMREKGVRVVLGTDGAASNNNLNLFEELKLAAILAKGLRRDPTAVQVPQALEMATAFGAAAQGRENCGGLQIGCRADLIMLDLTGPHMSPVFDAANNLLFAAQGSDVCMTMVDGRVLYRDGEYQTIDIERVRYQAQQSLEGIVGKLSV